MAYLAYFAGPLRVGRGKYDEHNTTVVIFIVNPNEFQCRILA